MGGRGGPYFLTLFRKPYYPLILKWTPSFLTYPLFLQNDEPPVKVVTETALPFNHSVRQKSLFILAIQQTY